MDTQVGTDRATTVRDFAALYDRNRIWQRMTWRGIDCAKIPTDCWMYQEIIWRVRPRLIVEFGTNIGGSGLFFADLLEMLWTDAAVVASVDIDQSRCKSRHSRLITIGGDACSDSVRDRIYAMAEEIGGPVLISEDSSHAYEPTAAILRMYCDLVSSGSYFVVEDTGGNGEAGRAVKEFLSRDRRFWADPDCERYLHTLCPGGWLKRIR